VSSTPTSPNDTPAPNPAPAEANAAALKLESRPRKLYGATYERLPFPLIGPVQEVAFDLGITALNADLTLSGLVFRGYSGHQLLFEQRWPARIIKRRTGEQDLRIQANTGLAVRSLHFQLHAYELLTSVEVTAVAKSDASEEPIQTNLSIPVTFPEQQTDLHFPLEGAWWAIQAADWSDQHKTEVYSQTYAIDFVKLGPDNSTFRGNGLALEDHYSWNQPVYAPAGGKVAYVCYDMPDIAPGTRMDQRIMRDDLRRLLGNAVAISHANGEFSYFGHLQQASIEVNQGEIIRRGRLLGRVGNSGYSPGPNLHYQLMEGPNLFIDQGLPVKFSHFSAGGQYFEQLTTIPTRMIVFGPSRSTSESSDDAE
jgi:murein DD-endopeptidase MepM/ murein hydrolase activator NlpD